MMPYLLDTILISKMDHMISNCTTNMKFVVPRFEKILRLQIQIQKIDFLI